MINNIKYCLFLCFLFAACMVFAQPTKVRGIVTDSDTNEPVSFANVVFKGTLVGITTDENGYYFLETRENVDSLHVSFVGYFQQMIPIKKHGFKTINIKLKPKSFNLQEVTVITDKKKEKDEPAIRIFKNIVANKKRNNPDRYDTYQYETYNKLELDLTNISEKFQNKKILRSFDFVWEYLDTSAVTGKSFLPIMISESLSDFYFSKKTPRVKREIIKASKIAGFEQNNTSIAQFTGKLYQDINIYENYIELFDQGFISPISNTGLLFYRYYLTDSAFRKNAWCYQISFRPKRKEDPAFVGEFWVVDTVFAIQDINMRITGNVNLNWVNDVVLQDNFQQINDSIWFWEKQYMFVDFTLVESDSTKSKGFFGKKTTTYDKIRINEPIDEDVLKYDKEMIVNEDALLKDSIYWNQKRPYELSQQEAGIYDMVDSIKEVPLYKTFVDIIKTAIGGYYDLGYFEVGPYYKMFSFNDFESYRLRFGGRTTSKLSEKIQFTGHLAFGTGDKDFKYNAGLLYMINPKNQLRHNISVGSLKDIRQLGKSPNAFTESNILASVLARNPSTKLTLIEEYWLNYNREWKSGFSNNFKFKHQIIGATGTVNFLETDNYGGRNLEEIKTSEASLNFRWTKNEIIVERTFERYSLGSIYPIINLKFTLGSKFMGGDFNYSKIDLTYEHDFFINPMGELRYIIVAGKVFGSVPYPFLKLHAGNETYAFDPYAYNMMNYYEFASDQYASIYVEHHFNGFFLNKIPFFKKLRWRTLISGKALWGTLGDKNNGSLTNTEAVFYFPDGLSELNKPYFEGSIGIENIFKLIRIDAVWRLSHLKPKGDQEIEKFGIRASLQFTF